MKIINSIEEYLSNQAVEPMSNSSFYIPLSVRKEIQEHLFGKGNKPAVNEKFYRFVWKTHEHKCEECRRQLDGYSATFVSHILSRGAYPEMAHDVRNVNILCFRCHAKWENGNRQKMSIFKKNVVTIESLKSEYNNNKVKQVN